MVLWFQGFARAVGQMADLAGHFRLLADATRRLRRSGRVAAVMARIPTITTLAAARAAAEGIASLQRGSLNVYVLQELHAAREASVA